MKLLRQLIRQIILEGPVKDAFEQAWYNSEGDSERTPWKESSDTGTLHRDQLEQEIRNQGWLKSAGGVEGLDSLFQDKRDLKRIWNNIIDANELRSFWEGPKMKYFHSLGYYNKPTKAVDDLQLGVTNDNALRDLSAEGFFKLYNKTGNKDEMSTYGIYKGSHQIPPPQDEFGVIISGRVTLATAEDAFTESRSKATPKDLERHAGSGMPKRILATNEMVSTLLFEEEELIENPGDLGECIIDNWSIDAIVCKNEQHKLYPAAEKLADEYGVPLISLDDIT